MQTAFINYRSSRIHYSYGGQGEKLLVCFHGYGESVKTFDFLEKHLPPSYSILAIDLPFHGDTVWNEGLELLPEELKAIVITICGVHGLRMDKLVLAGFSMGGRVALTLYQMMPAQTDRILLLAPDGLKVNIWYRIATRTLIGNRFFKYTMHHPEWFLWLLKAGNKMGMINQSIFKFTSYYIHDRQIREDLYMRWTCMRHFKPVRSQIKQLVKQHATPVRLLYGQYDRIIRHQRGEIFRRGIESFCTLRIIPTGHQVLQEKNAAVIIGLLES